jgi:hypothetical protein
MSRRMSQKDDAVAATAAAIEVEGVSRVRRGTVVDARHAPWPCTLRWCFDKCGCRADHPPDGVGTMSWAEERRRRVPPRTCTAAILLFTFGTILVLAGLNIMYNGERSRGVQIVVIGGLMFLPGSYASWILFGAWYRWHGYEFHQVPSYDSD